MNLYRNCHIAKIMKVRESRAQTSFIAITYHKCSKYSLYIYIYISTLYCGVVFNFQIEL